MWTLEYVSHVRPACKGVSLVAAATTEFLTALPVFP